MSRIKQLTRLQLLRLRHILVEYFPLLVSYTAGSASTLLLRQRKMVLHELDFLPCIARGAEQEVLLVVGHALTYALTLALGIPSVFLKSLL